jgi:hypothetical protein
MLVAILDNRPENLMYIGVTRPSCRAARARLVVYRVTSLIKGLLSSHVGTGQGHLVGLNCTYYKLSSRQKSSIQLDLNMEELYKNN